MNVTMMNKIISVGKIKTSKTELIDITKAWIALSFAFAIILFPSFFGVNISLMGSDFSISTILINIFSINFLLIFVISLFTAGLGFLLHELAHKFVAQKYGCVAEFRAFDQMLYIAVGLAMFIGFIFAAPGAVMISGNITRRENGIISVAGPMTNYILAVIFIFLSFLLAPGIGKIILQVGFSINMILGVFNLIPFGNLDGLKVLQWNKTIWAILFISGIAVVIKFVF